MEETYLSIPLKLIADTNTYTIHDFFEYEATDSTLAESIDRFGLLRPPIVIANRNNNYDVISGRQRLYCVTSLLKNQHCHCRVLPFKCEIEKVLLLLLEDQFSSSDLSTIEQACFLTLCRKLIPKKDDFNEFWGMLPKGRITKGTHFLDQFTQLNDTMKRKIHFSVLSEKVAVDLQKFQIADQSLFLTLIESLQLGLNNQKKLLRELKEAVSRQQQSLASFLKESTIQEILTHSDMNQPQKATKLFEILFTINYPLFSKASENFSNRIKALKMPKNCKLSGSTAFEKDEVELTIRFKNFDIFAQSWPDIKTALPQQ